MSKYIDADLYVEMQLYDDEHEEWSIWNGTIEDLLNQWTEEGCPTPIEISEDCIDRADLIASFLADNECEREEAKACMCSLDLMLELIEDAPSVTPTERTGGWIYGNGNGECSVCGREKSLGWDNYCGYCGAEMEA